VEILRPICTKSADLPSLSFILLAEFLDHLLTFLDNMIHEYLKRNLKSC
jgi:hypothetical protein